MPALIPTDITGKVTWLGKVAKREINMRSVSVSSVTANFAGIEGEDHSGLTRPACVRTRAQYKPGTEIRNFRQISIVSAEELLQIAAQMGIEQVKPEWLGASMVVKGIPDFTLIPPSSRLQFAENTTLTVDMENRPCQFPAREIENEIPAKGALFKAAAQNLRGVTAWVEREGTINVGDTISLHVPNQRAWKGS